VIAATAVAPLRVRERLLQNRWLILFFSIVSMVTVANYQYALTLFVNPLQKKLGAEVAVIQIANALDREAQGRFSERALNSFSRYSSSARRALCACARRIRHSESGRL